MNPNKEDHIIDLEVTMKVSIGFSMPPNSHPDLVYAIAEGIVGNIDNEDLIENYYKIEAVNIVDVEKD
jgi:hypothetical protein